MCIVNSFVVHKACTAFCWSVLWICITSFTSEICVGNFVTFISLTKMWLHLYDCLYLTNDPTFHWWIVGVIIVCISGTGGSISPSAVSSRSQRSVESFFGSKSVLTCISITLRNEFISHWISVFSRFNLGRLKGNNGKQAPLKAHCLSAETDRHIATVTSDYLPLVGVIVYQFTKLITT